MDDKRLLRVSIRVSVEIVGAEDGTDEGHVDEEWEF